MSRQDFSLNPATLLRENAKNYSQKIAIIAPEGQLTYCDLETRSDEFAIHFHQAGVRAGCKTILMVPHSLDMYITAFALFKIGAIPVVVDPGMGIKRLLHCYQKIEAEAFIGITAAHLVRLATPQFFKQLKSIIWLRKGKLTYRTSQFNQQNQIARPFPIVQVTNDQLAMINFTTGSTGPAKPVMTTYGAAVAMVSMIQARFGNTADDLDLVTVPLFGLVSLMIGSRMVIPDMNPAKPAAASPKKIISTILHHGITSMFASPALLGKLAKYAAVNGVKLPSLRCVNSGGAPITLDVLSSFNGLVAGPGRFHSTYGATEGLPLASISADELLADASDLISQGKGTPIGVPIDGVSIRIIRIIDKPLPDWSYSLLAPTGEVGEIIVAGSNVSRGYFESDDANALHKIADTSATETLIWHRTGDLGWLDSKGRIIFCGRASHRVTTAAGELMFSVACEGVSNQHPNVSRSALVGVHLDGGIQPVMCIELKSQATAAEKGRIQNEIRTLLEQRANTKNIRHILFHRSFPVDLRHNAKIERPQLALWAIHELKKTSAERMKSQVLKLIPVIGWTYILVGLWKPLPDGFWLYLWYIDLFLSIIVHSVQTLISIPIGKIHGYSASESALQTLLFGATWWKPLRLVFNKRSPN